MFIGAKELPKKERERQAKKNRGKKTLMTERQEKEGSP